jgi:hypothetical protein
MHSVQGPAPLFSSSRTNSDEIWSSNDPIRQGDYSLPTHSKPDDRETNRQSHSDSAATATGSGNRAVLSGAMAEVYTGTTMDQSRPPLSGPGSFGWGLGLGVQGSMPTFGPPVHLSDETVRGILEALRLGRRYDAGKLTMHDIVEVAAFGENSGEITQEQYALLTNDPANFLDWFHRHQGDACIDATTATPDFILRLWGRTSDSVVDPTDYDEESMAIVLPSTTTPREWSPLCHAMLKRNETERMMQEDFEDLEPLRMKFDEGIIPWFLKRGAVFEGLPSRSSHLHLDFLARALTYMDDNFLEGMLPRIIDSLGGYDTPSGCPLMLIALDHGHFTVARRLLEHGANGSVTGSAHSIFTDLDNPAFDQFNDWLADTLASFDTFVGTVLLASLDTLPGTMPPTAWADQQGGREANLLPRLRGLPGVLEHIAKFADIKSGPVMKRIREVKARFGFTMATRQRRSHLLDQVADMFTIDRHYGRDTPTRVWGGLTATPEPVHQAARNKFEELWERSLELDPPLLPVTPRRLQFGSSVSPAVATRVAAAASTLTLHTSNTSSATSNPAQR